MTEQTRQLIQAFFAAIGRGDSLAELITEDMGAWTVSSGKTDRERFLGGVKLLGAIFGGSLRYDIDALTVQEDRAVAEVTSHGTLPDGAPFSNVHAFIFRIRDGRIASVAEFMNQLVVEEKIAPLIQQALGAGNT